MKNVIRFPGKLKKDLQLEEKRVEQELIDYFGEIGFPIQRIQTDCGPEFYNEALQRELMEHFIKFRPNPPGKPHLNGKVERPQKLTKKSFIELSTSRTRN